KIKNYPYQSSGLVREADYARPGQSLVSKPRRTPLLAIRPARILRTHGRSTAPVRTNREETRESHCRRQVRDRPAPALRTRTRPDLRGFTAHGARGHHRA